MILRMQLIIPFFLYLMWDVYHIRYGKVFDLLGFVASLTLFFLFFRQRKLRLPCNDVIFILYVLIITVIGFVFGGISATLAVLFGLVTFFLFRSANLSEDSTYKILSISFYFIFAFQILQFIYFYLTGISLIFYPVQYFVEPRNFDGVLFRASGFMAEGNAMASTVVLISIAITSLRKIPKPFIITACFSLLISKSIYGIIMIPFLLVISGVLKKKHLFVLSLLVMPVVIRYVDFSIMIFRLSNFFDDPSFVARFGLGNLSEMIPNMLLPSGFNTTPGETIAANGVVFALDAFGILILPLLFILFNSLNVRSFLLLVLLMVSYQMFTTQLFWAVLGLLKTKGWRAKNVRVA